MTQAWDKAILNCSSQAEIEPKLKICHLYSMITTHHDFDSADFNTMQEACHI